MRDPADSLVGRRGSTISWNLGRTEPASSADRETAAAAEAERKPIQLVVVGGGAGGVELALSMQVCPPPLQVCAPLPCDSSPDSRPSRRPQARLLRELSARGVPASLLKVSLVSRSTTLMPQHTPAIRGIFAEMLARRGIETFLGEEVVGAIPPVDAAEAAMQEVRVARGLSRWVARPSAASAVHASPVPRALARQPHPCCRRRHCSGERTAQPASLPTHPPTVDFLTARAAPVLAAEARLHGVLFLARSRVATTPLVAAPAPFPTCCRSDRCATQLEAAQLRHPRLGAAHADRAR